MTSRHATYRIIVCLLLVFSGVGYGAAQNATSSPSSRFGYGELNDNIPGTFRAMGGVSTGMRSRLAINSSQPASYTGCDSLAFMMDVAGSVMWTNYSDKNGRKNKANGNLEYLMLQFPIWKRYIAFSAGVMPYSCMGYDFALDGSAGGHSYTVSYYGEGNVAQAYGGLSFNLFDWVAVGGNFYYMFGSLENITALTFTDASLLSSLMYRSMSVSSWRGRYGLQVFHTFKQKHNIVLGAIFESKLPFKNTYVQYELNTLDSVLVTDRGFELPMVWSVGVSYTYDRRLVIAFDYTQTRWSEVNYFGGTEALRNRNKFALGVEYRHNPIARNYAERMRWRVGASMVDPYSVDTKGKDFTVSMGIGFPFRTSATMFNATIEFTRRNTFLDLKENVLKLTVNAAINETWFMKRKL